VPENDERAPFKIDPDRLFDVAPDGKPRRAALPLQWLDGRHRALLAWAALGGLVIGGFATLTVFAFALGQRLWAAVFALATLAAAPLLGAGPALDWWRHRRR
jgi:hypothetical protein